jgi:hypothetical protein
VSKVRLGDSELRVGARRVHTRSQVLGDERLHDGREDAAAVDAGLGRLHGLVCLERDEIGVGRTEGHLEPPHARCRSSFIAAGECIVDLSRFAGNRSDIPGRPETHTRLERASIERPSSR